MARWKPVNKIGIATWNYSPEQSKSNRLVLSIGELVHIYEECDHWFHGYSLISDSNQRGIFPKSFILVQNYGMQITNIFGEIYYKFTFEQEVIFVLREWTKVMKKIYIKGNQRKFHKTYDFIIEIIGYYQRLKSGKLTSDELKNLKIEIIEKFDIGNEKLKLDLTIRNNDGFTINPLETNIIDYFRQHESKQKTNKLLSPNDRSSKNSNSYRSSISILQADTQSSSNCYSICVSLINFICTIRQDMDILMSIYDSRESKFVSENFIVKWDKGGLMHDIDKLNNIRVVFTDLSKNDFLAKKLFLVCHVIRIGSMNLENQKNLHKKNLQSNSKKSYDDLKRPCGIAVYDLSEFISKPWEFEENREIFFPFIPYCEKESLDLLVRKFTRDVKDQKDISKSQGFRISMRLISSYKMQLLEQYSVYYSQYPSYIARKIGFPDIILPEDVRNDLYLTLVSGEFNKGSKKSERNIEVTVRVFNSKGDLIENCFSVGADNAMRSLYRSVVYYHEEKPKWMETIKISLSIEQFCDSHLKFTFKHRSSNESKDKNEKPFALAYIKLMNENGTTLKNDFFDIFIYKIDSKKFNDDDISYLNFPSSKSDIIQNCDFKNDQSIIKNFIAKNHPSSSFTFSPKDVFTFSTVVCSTKLAQNINIFGLLNWKEKKQSLETILTNILKLDGGDVVKFLHDALDSLFEIWMDDSLNTTNDRLAFNALVYIIQLLLQEKYMHFQDILNDYIEKNFSATLVFIKLIDNFKYYIETPHSQLSFSTITCMEYIFKFIVRSRSLFALLNNDKDKALFEKSLEELFKQFTDLMDDSDEKSNIFKSELLKNFPKIIENISSVFDKMKLTITIANLLFNIHFIDNLYKEKLDCMNNIVLTQLFKDHSECRRKILPVINRYLQANLLIGVEELRQCNNNPIEDNIMECVNDRLDKCLMVIKEIICILIKQDARLIKNDISDIANCLLLLLIETFQTVGSNPVYTDYRYHLWTVIIAFINQMTTNHYEEFFDHFVSVEETKTFVMKLLQVFQESFELIYPKSWVNMNILQNIVIVKSMSRVVNCVKERIPSDKTHVDLWTGIFVTAFKFITQSSLQLENFSKLKRKRIKLLYKDMRIEMVTQIRSLWYNFGNHKKEFLPAVIGPLLEVALIPVLDIRQYTVIIFFDMFYSCFEQNIIIRNEIITQLDVLITSGKGDRSFKILFENTFLDSCENHPQKLKDVCFKFIEEVSEQIDKLLTYCNVVKSEDDSESLMSSIIDLLDFYERIDRKEMYIRYLYKLYDLHIKCENFNEAAYTLSKHGMLLEWSDRPLESLLRNEKYKFCNSHRELKEQLYYEIIDNFNNGQLWEAGIIFCKELIQQYENVFFDYVKLSMLFTKLSSFYNLIITSVRVVPEYFHVTYIGNGFPTFFRGKSFIYRGKGYERLLEFTKRLQSQFPNAILLEKLDIPDNIFRSDGQYLSIYRVDPVMNEAVKNKFNATLVDEKIVNYYKYNQICNFVFSRKLIKHERPASNEFASMWIERSEFKTVFTLPGILCRSEIVQKKSYELDPLKNAIDTMEKVNENTRRVINRYLSDNNDSLPFHILLMHINGIVNSDVQGGVAKYEEAFFQNENADYSVDDLSKLKELISCQIPLLNLAINVADVKRKSQKNQAMDGLYQHIVESFHKMREDVEMKYGKSDLPSDLKKLLENHYKTQNLAFDKTSVASNKSNRNSIEIPDNFGTLTKSRSLFGRVNGSTTNLTNTLRFRRKESRRVSTDSSNIVYVPGVITTQTQWYTESESNLNNNNNQHHNCSDFLEEPSRQMDKKNSRPNSGNYNNRSSIQSHLSLLCRNNTSLSTLTLASCNEKFDSEKDVPPPLPIKESLVENESVAGGRKISNGQEAIYDNFYVNK